MNNLNLRSALKILRQEIGDDDVGMMRVHNFRRQKRTTPEWATDDKAVQKILLTSFPKLQTDEKQRRRAARWVRIIFLYYRKHMSYSQVAEELEELPERIGHTLCKIRRASRGQQTGTGKKRVKS